MPLLYQNIGQIILMLLLLCGSAFFSGTETAFFNLTKRQLNKLKNSPQKIRRLTAGIMDNPQQLLAAILFGNMAVNVLFFACSSILTIKMKGCYGSFTASMTAAVSLVVLIIFGEILPKAVAFDHSKSISLFAAIPIAISLKIFNPLWISFRILVVEPVTRLTIGLKKPPRAVNVTDFIVLMNNIQKTGFITTDENRIFSSIIQLGFLKVRHIMMPRVEIISCQKDQPINKIIQMMCDNNLTKIPIYNKNIDDMIGIVQLRDIMLNRNVGLNKLLRSDCFVPETKTVESLLEFFRKTKTDTALAVEEYGGISGMVCLEDIAGELVGSVESGQNDQLIEQIGPAQYRLDGDMPLHEWSELFGAEADITRLSTIAGLVTYQLDKIPSEGDIVNLNNFKFTVERIEKRRIKTILLSLEKTSNDD